jgi:signal transduction histidine kinase
LRQYVRSTEERSGLSCQLTVTGFDQDVDERLLPQVETALFRIAQEALTNAIRHAHATSVQVRLRRTSASVTLEVRDDGVGLGAAPSADGEHLGMFGMRERARLLGGTFVATPVSPRGTLVQASVPL